MTTRKLSAFILTILFSGVDSCGESTSSTQHWSASQPSVTDSSSASTSTSTSDVPSATEPQSSAGSSTSAAAQVDEDEVFATCVARLSLGELPVQFGMVVAESDPDELRATVGFLALQVLNSDSNPLLSILFGAEHPMTNPTPVDASAGLIASMGTFEEGGRVLVIHSEAASDPCLPISLITYRMTETEVRHLALTTGMSPS